RPGRLGPPQARVRDRQEGRRRLSPALVQRRRRHARRDRARAQDRRRRDAPPGHPSLQAWFDPASSGGRACTRGCRRTDRQLAGGGVMAQNINSVVLVGNLTKDPELRHTPSGTAVCSLRLAVNTRRKDGATGEWTEKPNYFDITVWGNQG